MSDSKREAFEGLAISVVTAKLKFEIRNIIVDKEILGEDVLELVYNFGDDTVNMREIEMEEKIRLK
jgi:hypothetical protein